MRLSDMAPRPSPQTERVVNLFEHLAADASRGLTLAEVSRHLSVHKASCHSMLSELLRVTPRERVETGQPGNGAADATVEAARR